MTKRELDQAWVFSILLKNEMTQQEAAVICGLSARQIRRKLKRFQKDGVLGLQHQSRGKPSNRKFKLTLVQDIIMLVKSKYSGFGPTLAAEKLEENHSIKIDHETLRRLMIKNKIYIERKKKTVQRAKREPKHHKGELVQLDGSFHVWFGKEYCNLLVFVDDATKEVFCRFAKESTRGVTETFALYIKKYGRPLNFYTDKGKVFKVNNGKNKDAITQFRRMLNELGIGIIYAHSPQAKGRVERMNRTLQDRLVKELKLLNVKTIDQANAMLDEFLVKFNKKFSIPSKKDESLFRPIDGYNLNSILCNKYKRKLNNDYTLSYKNELLQLDKKQPLMLYPRDTIEIQVAFDETKSLWKKGIKLNFKEIEKLPKPKIEINEYKIDNRGKKAPSNHPWRGIYRKPVIENVDISKESKRGHF